MGGAREDLRSFAKKPESMAKHAMKLPERIKDTVADLVMKMKSNIKEREEHQAQLDLAVDIPDFALLADMTGCWPELCSGTMFKNLGKKPTAAESKAFSESLAGVGETDTEATPVAKFRKTAKCSEEIDEGALEEAAKQAAKNITTEKTPPSKAAATGSVETPVKGPKVAPAESSKKRPAASTTMTAPKFLATGIKRRKVAGKTCGGGGGGGNWDTEWWACPIKEVKVTNAAKPARSYIQGKVKLKDGSLSKWHLLTEVTQARAANYQTIVEKFMNLINQSKTPMTKKHVVAMRMKTLGY